jgi:GTP cyclohydrolase III
VQEVEIVEVRRSGFVTFVGVIALVIGVDNAVGGIAAIAKDDRTEAVAKVLFDIDISVGAGSGSSSAWSRSSSAASS